MSKLTAIAVFCGSSPSNDDIIFRAAYGVGKSLATVVIDVGFGCSKLGRWGQVAQGALDTGGKVIGVIPEFLRTKEVVLSHLTELVITESMQERKLKMHELSNGIITLPGGFGTFEELFEMLTWAQLGLHKKPIGLLNTNGYYNDLIVMLKTMVKKELLSKENFELLLVDSDLNQLIKKMENFKPLPVPKWMNKDQA